MVGYFLDGLGNMPQIEIIGKRSTEGRTAVVSIDIPGKDNGEVSHRLYREYGISTRCGLHLSLIHISSAQYRKDKAGGGLGWGFY